MKRILALTLSLAALGLFAPAASAKAATPSVSAAVVAAAPQWRNQRNRWRVRRVRTTTQTRLVRVGRRVYRETYQVTYLPNGRTQTRLISRVRVR